MSWLIVAIVLAIVLPVAVAGVLLAPRPSQPGFPAGSGQRVLLSDQAQNINGLYERQFTLPAVPLPVGVNSSVRIQIVALVNVSCGGASYFGGATYQCSLSLVQGATGGPTENLLWELPFSGVVGTNVSPLYPGLYTLLVHVWIGTAPAAVLLTTFNVAVEVVELS